MTQYKWLTDQGGCCCPKDHPANNTVDVGCVLVSWWFFFLYCCFLCSHCNREWKNIDIQLNRKIFWGTSVWRGKTSTTFYLSNFRHNIVWSSSWTYLKTYTLSDFFSFFLLFIFSSFSQLFFLLYTLYKKIKKGRTSGRSLAPGTPCYQWVGAKSPL